MSVIRLFRENDKIIPVTLTDNDVAVNITGYTFYLTVRTQLLTSDNDDSDAIIQKDVTSHTNPTQGQTQFVLTSSDTDITPQTYFYDIAYKDTSNKVRTVETGCFVVLPNSTGRI